MGKDVCFSRAERADLDAVCGIEKRSFGAEGFSRRQLLYLMTRASGFFYVARHNGTVVAYLSLLLTERARHLRIYSIAVGPEARGAGIGAGLMELARQCALERGVASISLEVKSTNREAIRLYERAGFVKKKLLPAYYPDQTDAYRMHCPL
ncbi:MAG: GNAT family N-acetyltransferase [Culturomica sp.]|jgi:ribosomal-protein-alanine acetyltransferase|nr:GNAT family N-acetyltransferase [Culturomica sp.]